MGIRQWVQWETMNAPAIQHSGRTITPQSQAVTVRLPIPYQQSIVGFVWNRPVAVLVQQGAEVTRIPIYNLNRLLIVILLGIFTPFLLALWFFSRTTGLLK